MSSEIAILIEGLNFKYPGSSSYLLEDINLTILRGHQVGIIGGNGCGKSTLSKLLLGIFLPTEGNIKIFGKAVNWTAHFPEMGYIGDPGHNAEELGLPVKLTIWETIQTISSLYNAENTVTNPIEMIKKLGLYDLRNRQIRQLSTGERKRLMICLTFLKCPDLIILDEPFDGLDKNIVVYVNSLIKQAIESEYIAILLISHSRVEIDTYTNTVYQLQDRKLSTVVQRKFKGSIQVGDSKENLSGKAGEIIGELSSILRSTEKIESILVDLNEIN